jgi:serine/threonine-protein kinase
MAPEQMRGGSIDHRADLYAVGSVLFEVIAGQPPLDAEDLSQLMARVLHARAPALSSHAWLPLPVRDQLDGLVARCLEKQPSDRPASAREVIAVIDEVAQRLAMVTSGRGTEGSNASMASRPAVLHPLH